MRNLLGRLNARSADELVRIATAWQVPVSGGDKLGQVAQLYRALTDIRAVRDVWERLPSDEREVIAALALGDESARPIADLARELGHAESDVRQTAIRLYHKGILTREGDDDPLPVGETPRLFLPRELALQFQRVQDETSAGDISRTPLRTLLGLLDDREIEEAAETWGIRVIPGLRTRDELIRQILQQVSDPDRLDAVQGKLKRDAAAIWQSVRETPAPKLTPYAQAHTAASLNIDDPRHALRLRQALGDLEEALLVWHTYGPDGSRWLFVPADIGTPEARPNVVAAPPTPVAVSDVGSAIFEHAVAWDLLTLLRALAPPQDHRVTDVNEAIVPWKRAVNAGLWNRGKDVPPAGYLDFLADLGRVEGVLTGGDAAIDEPFLVTSHVRTWRDRTFADQTSRLLNTWLGSTTWIEGSARDDVEVWGADWAGFRFKMLSHLAQLDRNAFVPIDDVANWLADRDPQMLGDTFQAATARNTEVLSDEAASRKAAIAEVATVTLETAFAWFGLVEIAQAGRGPRLLRLTSRGAAVANGKRAEEAISPESGAAVRFIDGAQIELTRSNPLQVWSLSAFADLVTLGPPAVYGISERSISRALRAGFEVRHIVDFLARQSGRDLPAQLAEQIESWSRAVRRLVITRTLRITVDDPAELDHVRAAAAELDMPVTDIPSGLLIEIREAAEQTMSEARLLTRLRELGFTANAPAVTKPQPPAPRGRQQDHRRR